MNKSKAQEWVDKWKDGSIVDEWINSKPTRKFQAYHPFLTYSDRQSTCFVRCDGKPCGKLNEDTHALFEIGLGAFHRLPKMKSKEEFDKSFLYYFQFIENVQQKGNELVTDGYLIPIDDTNEEITLNWSEFDESQIIAIAWQFFSNGNILFCEDKEAIRNACLWHALREIDNAIIALDINASGSVIAAIEACNALANAISIESGDEKLQQARREIAIRGANAKHVKTYEKRKQIIEYWKENIPYDTSIEKAAEWLKDSFPDIAHRTLCRYISEAKKESKS